MMHNNEQMTKPEQDSKVEKPHYCCPWREKNTKFANIQQLNTIEENI